MTINLRNPSLLRFLVGIILAIILVLLRLPLYLMLLLLLVGLFIFDMVFKYLNIREPKIKLDIPKKTLKKELRDKTDYERRAALRENVLKGCRENDQFISSGQEEILQPALEFLNVYTEPSDSVTEELNRFIEYKQRWEAGKKSLEMGLQLMFLAWDLQDPVYGLDLDHPELPETFRNVYLHFGGTSSNELEVLFAAGYMITMFFLRTAIDEAEGERCLKKFNKLKPEGYPATHFKGRGDYGRYFTYIISESRSS